MCVGWRFHVSRPVPCGTCLDSAFKRSTASIAGMYITHTRTLIRMRTQTHTQWYLHIHSSPQKHSQPHVQKHQQIQRSFIALKTHYYNYIWLGSKILKQVRNMLSYWGKTQTYCDLNLAAKMAAELLPYFIAISIHHLLITTCLLMSNSLPCLILPPYRIQADQQQ